MEEKVNELIEESRKIRKTITENIEKNGFSADGSYDAAKHMELMETMMRGMLMEIEYLKVVKKKWKKKALFGEELVQVEAYQTDKAESDGEDMTPMQARSIISAKQKEIKDDLFRCIESVPCSRCGHNKKDGNCVKNLMKDALDLINLRETENEVLRASESFVSNHKRFNEMQERLNVGAELLEKGVAKTRQVEELSRTLKEEKLRNPRYFMYNNSGGIDRVIAELENPKETYETINDMFDELTKHGAMGKEDLCIRFHAYDPRIKRDVYKILTDRYFEEDYIMGDAGHPQFLRFFVLV